jgi:membrane protease subunit HflK
MSWKNQSGGPWGGGPRGPWGSGQQPGPGRGGGNQPPDLEDLIRRGQDRLKNVLPGSGNFGGRGALILIFAAIVIWLLSGFYRVNTDEQGIVLRFGKFVQTTQPGLNYHLPYPIETALTPRVTFENKIDIGFRTQEDFRRGTITRDVAEESLMSTSRYSGSSTTRAAICSTFKIPKARSRRSPNPRCVRSSAAHRFSRS